jgi:hypothetical protein
MRPVCVCSVRCSQSQGARAVELGALARRGGLGGRCLEFDGRSWEDWVERDGWKREKDGPERSNAAPSGSTSFCGKTTGSFVPQLPLPSAKVAEQGVHKRRRSRDPQLASGTTAAITTATPAGPGTQGSALVQPQPTPSRASSINAPGGALAGGSGMSEAPRLSLPISSCSTLIRSIPVRLW